MATFEYKGGNLEEVVEKSPFSEKWVIDHKTTPLYGRTTYRRKHTDVSVRPLSTFPLLIDGNKE